MSERGPLHVCAAVLALAGASCSGATEPRPDRNEKELVVLPVAPRSVRKPEGQKAGPERWSILAMRANKPLAFMREGGVLALSLLSGAQIELGGSSVTVFVRGKLLTAGVLTQSNAGPRIVFEDPNIKWLEGELTDETVGKRQLSNAWATFTLDRWTEDDPRVKLCAATDSGSPMGSTSSLTRRVTCEPNEVELAAEGHAVSVAR